MRCLTLAASLRDAGADVSFISREHPGHLFDVIKALGFPLHRLPAPMSPAEGWLGVLPDLDRAETQEVLAREGSADWLIVDHYGLDRGWEAGLRPWARRLLVIDDLANRRHDCDVLLDQNLCAGMETRYEGLVPPSCQQLIGPNYALLRPEFRSARQDAAPRDGQVRRLLIFFGGVDATNETAKALAAVDRLGLHELPIDVVAGASNPHLNMLRARCAEMPGVSLHVAVQNMAELMARADLALGAGGTTTWERCYLGLPTLILTLAENQVPLVQAVAAANAAWNLGAADTVKVEDLSAALQRVLATPHEIADVSRRAWALMQMNDQGPGVAEVLLEIGRVDA